MQARSEFTSFIDCNYNLSQTEPSSLIISEQSLPNSLVSACSHSQLMQYCRPQNMMLYCRYARKSAYGRAVDELIGHGHRTFTQETIVHALCENKASNLKALGLQAAVFDEFRMCCLYLRSYMAIDFRINR